MFEHGYKYHQPDMVNVVLLNNQLSFCYVVRYIDQQCNWGGVSVNNK